MDVSTTIRTSLASVLSPLIYEVDEDEDNDVTIPIFDEVVNPNVALPSLEGAIEVYVIIQDQQSQDSPNQTTCSVSIDADVTIRIVTKWGTVGSKRLCEEIGTLIDDKIRTLRNESKLSGVRKTRLTLSRTITETTDSNLAFSKILIYNNKLNI